LFSLSFIAGNGYITTAVLKEILRELDDTLNNDDLDAMIEGKAIKCFESLDRHSRHSSQAESKTPTL
jgi:hypothetical protein